MGQARQRGTYDERKAQAIAAGRTPESRPRRGSVNGAARSALADLFGWSGAVDKDGNKLPGLFKRVLRQAGMRATDARGREYVFDGESIRRVR